MEVGGWKTTSVFHRYAIVDNQDIADAMEYARKESGRTEATIGDRSVARNASGPAAMNDFSRANERETPTTSSEGSVGTSHSHHVEVSRKIFHRLHRGTRRVFNAVNYRELSAGAGRGVEPPRADTRRILKGMAPSCFAFSSRSFSSTNRNSACGSTNVLISQGHATRSTLMSFRVISY